jgi:hypothetical protein
MQDGNENSTPQRHKHLEDEVHALDCFLCRYEHLIYMHCIYKVLQNYYHKVMATYNLKIVTMFPCFIHV